MHLRWYLDLPLLFLIFTADGNYLLSGGYDKTIKLWNPYKGKMIREYLGHGYQVLGLDVFVDRFRSVYHPKTPAQPIFLNRSHDNAQIASCGGDKQPFLWDVTSGTVLRKFEGHLQTINCISFNTDSSVLVTGSYDQSVKCWDCKSRQYQPIQKMDEAKDSITSVIVNDHEIITGFVLLAS
jgi:mitogen-activated protein kinase organizer 1